MKRRHVTLCNNAINVKIAKQGSTSEQTVINYSYPAHPDKVCTHIVPDKWEIESVEDNIVNLINYDEVIPEPIENVLP